MTETPRLGPHRVPKELVAKYATNGPRYTSYPTAPQFTDELDWDEALRRWRRAKGSTAGLSMYVHVPFCNSRCRYCGCFTTVGARDQLKREYVDALLRNADWLLELVGDERPVQQLALGGGTPASLEPNQRERLIRGLGARFELDPKGERAIELDPRWIEESDLYSLIELGFNRFSFGVQDLDPTVQRNINRVLAVEKLESLLDYLRSYGHRSINLDLIYGLPGQEPDAFRRTIEQVIALRPSRIATFGYAHVPWVSPHQKVLEQYGILGPEARMKLFGLAYDLLLDAGYRHVGMDHFALPDDELIQALESRTLTRNFMGYTTRRGLDLVPLGASAIGAAGATYVQNTKSIDDYLTASGRDRWIRGYLLEEEDLLRRELILDLFCNFHLDIEHFEGQHQIDFSQHFAPELEALRSFVDDGLVELDKKSISVTPMGRFFVRNVAMLFDTFLKKEAGANQRYSKTI